MPYDAPGHADELTAALRGHWNATIRRAFDAQHDALKTRFFELDPDALRDARPAEPVTWSGDPRKPAHCVGADGARALSDWGLTGRRAVQLEYCEYLIVYRRDATGALRPKRVEITTEFREYWACVAMHAPDLVRSMATDVLGTEPSWRTLYGVADPHGLSVEEREIAFGHACAGHGNDRRLRVAGVPAQPTGRLNMERALFMTHPINGIDDLIYVAIFGAHAYCVSERDTRRIASAEDVFRAFKVAHLACNHADPAMSLGVYDHVFAGKRIAFANPIGVYIALPDLDQFSHAGATVPAEWARFSRGRPGSYQRLVFGPPDEHEAFLDDITVRDEPLTGGYQLLREVRLGPLLRIGAAKAIAEHEWEPLEPSPGAIACDDPESCKPVRELLARYEAEHAGRSAPRTMGDVAG